MEAREIVRVSLILWKRHYFRLSWMWVIVQGKERGQIGHIIQLSQFYHCMCVCLSAFMCVHARLYVSVCTSVKSCDVGLCDAGIDITCVRRSTAVRWGSLFADSGYVNAQISLALTDMYLYLTSTVKYFIPPTGATKDVGAALTRICLRHRAVESRVKTLTKYVTVLPPSPPHKRFNKVIHWRTKYTKLN